MKISSISCDKCAKDLTYTGNCQDYYLVLTYGSKAAWYEKEGLRGGAVTAMALSPPVSRTYHFCDLNCLDKWRDVERVKNARRKRWHDEHRETIPGSFIGINQRPLTRIVGKCPNDLELSVLYPNETHHTVNVSK